MQRRRVFGLVGVVLALAWPASAQTVTDAFPGKVVIRSTASDALCVGGNANLAPTSCTGSISAGGLVIRKTSGSGGTVGAVASSSIVLRDMGQASDLGQIGFGYPGTYQPVSLFAQTITASGNTNASVSLWIRKLTTDIAPSEGLTIYPFTEGVGYGFGALPSATVAFNVAPTFAPSTAATGVGIALAPVMTAAVGKNLYGVNVSGALTEAGSGTHAIVAGMFVAPAFGSAAASTTLAANLYVDSAPTIGASNYSAYFNGAVAIASGNDLVWGSYGRIAPASDGVWRMLDNAQTGFTRLIWGPSSSSTVALKRSSTTLQVRLGDDSGYAIFDADAFRVRGTTALDDYGSGTLRVGASWSLILSPSAYQTTAGGAVVQMYPSTGTNAAYVRANTTGNETIVGAESSVAATTFAGSTAYATLIGNKVNKPIEFFTNSAWRASINGSGMLFANNLYLIQNTSGGTQKSLLGLDSSNRLRLDIDGQGVYAGTGTRQLTLATGYIRGSEIQGLLYSSYTGAAQDTTYTASYDLYVQFSADGSSAECQGSVNGSSLGSPAYVTSKTDGEIRSTSMMVPAGATWSVTHYGGASCTVQYLRIGG
jgi:hypothetical protein